MKHHYVGTNPNDADHYSIGTNGEGGVLLQVGDTWDQARIIMTPEQALQLWCFLNKAISEAKDERLAASVSLNTPKGSNDD